MVCTQLYRLTSPNGKQYLGVTTQSIKRRLSQHSGCESVIGSALRKYGRENFEIEILVVGAEDYIYNLEKRAIEMFGTIAPNGYNLKDGGDGGQHTEQTRRKMSESARQSYANGRIHSRAMFGKKHSEEVKMKMSESHKQLYAEGYTHPRGTLGKKHTEETKRKMSETLTILVTVGTSTERG